MSWCTCDYISIMSFSRIIMTCQYLWHNSIEEVKLKHRIGDIRALEFVDESIQQNDITLNKL